jgi:hypothetical protein
MIDENVVIFYTTKKITTYSLIIFKYSAFLGPICHASRPPPRPLFHAASPEGSVVWDLGVWTGAWCMGAVRRQAVRPASQLPPGLDAGRVAANTANSMMTEGARV